MVCLRLKMFDMYSTECYKVITDTHLVETIVCYKVVAATVDDSAEILLLSDWFYILTRIKATIYPLFI